MEISKCGLSTITQKALLAKKIETTDQFIEILPKECRDFTQYRKLADAVTMPVSLIRGKLLSLKATNGKPGKLVAKIMEGLTGAECTITWFGQNYREKLYKGLVNDLVAIAGKVTFHPLYGYQIDSPEVFCKMTNFVTGYYPKYSDIKGVSNEMQFTLHKSLLRYVTEDLEFPILDQGKLLDKRTLYEHIHFPKSLKEYEEALRQVRIRQLLYFAINMKANYPKAGKGIRLAKTDCSDAFIKSMPYSLTADQQKVVDKIKDYTTSGNKLYALVQGDVSCGKTSCALYALFHAAGNGKQATLVAPTAVLAKQHYDEISGYAEKLNSLGYNIGVEYICSDMGAKEKRLALKRIENGESSIVVGTHATFTDKIKYKSLAVVVIDEEHRFGVAQREVLKAKAEEGAHIISMSATPIPRTLASVLYGDACEVMSIKTMPPGRMRVLSAICDSDMKAFRCIEKHLAAGRQCYVVCPLVTANDEFNKLSIEEAYEKYSAYFAPKGYKIGVAHGKLKKQDLADALDDFRNNQTQILIATTVIEVGVNIPNANIICIENAEMYGLSTLHQLRGRVGRGQYQSYCILKSEYTDNERLNVIYHTTDGFQIAEEDMKLRGTGNLLGLEQTGFDPLIALSIAHPDEYEDASVLADWVIKKGFTNLIINKPDGE